MQMSEEQQFQKGPYGKPADQLKVDEYCMIEDYPCKILNWSISKPSRHSHVKVSLVGKDIFTGKIYKHVIRATNIIVVPFITVQEFSLIGIQDDGFLVLLLNNGSTKEDVKLPEALGDENLVLVKEINEMFGDEKNQEILIEIISAMGKEKVIGVRAL